MCNLLEQIYEKVIYSGDEHQQVAGRLEEEINKLISPYRNAQEIIEPEELQNLMYSVSYAAQQEGFKLGAKAVISLLTETLSQ